MLVRANLISITDDGEAFAEFVNKIIKIEESESVTRMYIIMIDVFEDGKLIRTELPGLSYAYTDLDMAWEYAYELANDECDSLNEIDMELISYGVVDQECNDGFICVNKYTLESEYDTTGETEMITKYRVVELPVYSE